MTLAWYLQQKGTQTIPSGGLVHRDRWCSSGDCRIITTTVTTTEADTYETQQGIRAMRTSHAACRVHLRTHCDSPRTTDPETQTPQIRRVLPRPNGLRIATGPNGSVQAARVAADVGSECEKRTGLWR